MFRWLCCTGATDAEEKISLLQPEKHFNVVVIGDVGCGKTSLIYRFTRGKLPGPEDRTTVLDYDKVDINRKRTKYVVNIHDTSGDELDARIRNAVYPSCDVFIVCFAIDSRESFQNVQAHWATEIRHLCGQAPFLLVGTKNDTRRERGAQIVKKAEGEKMARTVGAAKYFDFSAFEGKRSNRDAKLIFGKAMRVCLDTLDEGTAGFRCCCC